MSDIQHIESHTPDLTEENVDKLAALSPDVLTEVTDPQTDQQDAAPGQGTQQELGHHPEPLHRG